MDLFGFVFGFIGFIIFAMVAIGITIVVFLAIAAVRATKSGGRGSFEHPVNHASSSIQSTIYAGTTEAQRQHNQAHQYAMGAASHIGHGLPPAGDASPVHVQHAAHHGHHSSHHDTAAIHHHNHVPSSPAPTPSPSFDTGSIGEGNNGGHHGHGA